MCSFLFPSLCQHHAPSAAIRNAATAQPPGGLINQFVQPSQPIEQGALMNNVTSAVVGFMNALREAFMMYTGCFPAVTHDLTEPPLPHVSRLTKTTFVTLLHECGISVQTMLQDPRDSRHTIDTYLVGTDEDAINEVRAVMG